MLQKSDVIYEICSSLSAGHKEKAKMLAQEKYPFVSQKSVKRKMTDIERTQVFIDDGFIDRYSGKRLLYPGVIVLLFELLPEEFPYHPHWKVGSCHSCYWELYPTVDHIVSVTRGGTNERDNWVCTSMLRNSAKANSLLSEIGWKLHPRSKSKDWNGMIQWFIEYVDSHRELRKIRRINKWYLCAKKCWP